MLQKVVWHKRQRVRFVNNENRRIVGMYKNESCHDDDCWQNYSVQSSTLFTRILDDRERWLEIHEQSPGLHQGGPPCPEWLALLLSITGSQTSPTGVPTLLPFGGCWSSYHDHRNRGCGSQCIGKVAALPRRNSKCSWSWWNGGQLLIFQIINQRVTSWQFFRTSLWVVK